MTAMKSSSEPTSSSTAGVARSSFLDPRLSTERSAADDRHAADLQSGPSSSSRSRAWVRFLKALPSAHVPSEKAFNMGDRKTWPEICYAEEYRGRWVALDHCRYDETTMQPIEGDVVDTDDDLGSLCARMREAGLSSCAIRFCDTEESVEVPAPRLAGSEARASAR
jgi:hypothetical protein